MSAAWEHTCVMGMQPVLTLVAVTPAPAMLDSLGLG